MAYKNILIAVDSSKYSASAAREGLRLAKELKARVSMVYVIRPADPIGNIDSVLLPATPGKDEIDEGYKVLGDYADAYNPDCKPENMVKIGDPATEILQYASDWKADVIVIGRHGIESLKHLLLGGVVDNVAKNTKIPVLLVPFTNKK
ncbi:MAG: universal stress protein [Bacteroidales bacterium]|nr:universal stress protein [Bacteroidales bacterium]